MSSAVQLALLPGTSPKEIPCSSRKARQLGAAAAAKVIEQFRERLFFSGLAPKSVSAIPSQILTLLALAARISGEVLSPLELFGRPELLGMALAETRPISAGQPEYARWTLAARRHAALRFGRAFSRELLALHGVGGNELVNSAIRSQSVQVGSTFRLPGNLPFARRSRVASRDEAQALLDQLQQAPRLSGRAFGLAARIMLETGARVNGLRQLDARDVFIDPWTNRVTILVRSKGHVVEYELARPTGEALLGFIDAVNRRAEGPAIVLGSSGKVWITPRGLMSYASWNRSLTNACLALGIERLKPHDLRRTFATWAAEVSSRTDVALAAGWENLTTLDRHYIHPPFPEFAASPTGNVVGTPTPMPTTAPKKRKEPDAAATPASIV